MVAIPDLTTQAAAILSQISAYVWGILEIMGWVLFMYGKMELRYGWEQGYVKNKNKVVEWRD